MNSPREVASAALAATTCPRVLERVTSPQVLSSLTLADREQLAGEIRQLIKSAVGQHGGHLASNLGVVELTMALHTVFDFSRDRLLFDVGHQAYVHKVLTGRGPRMLERLRQANGISGFPAPDESPYDLFYVGHAGTAIATAVGLALGDKLVAQAQGQPDSKNLPRVVAVVGDASIVNGLAFEGLNNANKLKRQLMIILNDNGMSIDVAQGGMAEYLAKFRSSRFYEEVKRKAKRILPHMPGGQTAYAMLDHLKEGIKATISPHQFFEQLGLMYVGPTDGHDLAHLTELIASLADVQYPVLLHVQTEKGRGVDFARCEPCKFHSPSPFTEDAEGTVTIQKSASKSWTTAFADAMCELMRDDPRVAVFTAAMPDGTGVSKIREKFPERSFDCGIAESATVDICAGLAKSGMKPVAAIYSTFLQRAFDQAFQEVSLQGLSVVFAIDRAGLVGEDGAVHHGFLDLAFMRGLPNVELCAPADEPELYLALKQGLVSEHSTAVRYPRDNVPTPYASVSDTPAFVPGRARLMRSGSDVALLAYGTMVQPALEAAERLAPEVSAAVYNMRWAKPLDTDVLTQWLPLGVPVFTIEDHSIAGGFGSACLEAANELGLPTTHLHRLGLPADRYVRFASRKQQLAEVGLDAFGVAAQVRRALDRSSATVATPTQAEMSATRA